MSIHVWICRCGRRWYRFGRSLWDSTSAPTTRCPGCSPDAVDVLDWSEL